MNQTYKVDLQERIVDLSKCIDKLFRELKKESETKYKSDLWSRDKYIQTPVEILEKAMWIRNEYIQTVQLNL